tara:strand:- start:256 stop:1128 length:873 start_codon:yes stop_codon:yes gene_type:complete
MPNNLKEIPFMPSTLETIDYAIYNWLNEGLDLHTTTQGGFEKVPVIWSAAERAFQVKRDNDLRDQDGTLILPLITIERTSVSKDLSRKGTIWANIPPVKDEKGGSITIARRIKQDKTANFANADSWRKDSDTGPKQRTFPRRDSFGRPIKNKKVVYETITIPIPVYLDVTYSVSIKTEYQEQMNDLATPFMTRTGGVNYFTAKYDGHRFESFIQPAFSQDNNVSTMEAEHRNYETRIDIKTLGYIIGEGKNQEKPKMVIRENAVEVKLPREKVIVGHIPEHIDKRGFYRE